jgi:circadian clock protein KaiC
MSTTPIHQTSLCTTGVEGLDEILAGGLPPQRLYLVQGDPGSGKTTLALQFLLEGVKRGEKVLYISLSETKQELTAVAKSHGWSLDGIAVLELSSFKQLLDLEVESTVFHPSEVELNKTMKLLLQEVEQVNPTRLVLDSLSEVRLLTQDPMRYRRQMLYLKQFFAGGRATVMLLDDKNVEDGDLQVQSIAHGVLTLRKISTHYGTERRQISPVKIRGHKFKDGQHDYVIATGGLEVYPRIQAPAKALPFQVDEVASGIPEIDVLLGGGLRRGTSTLIMGPAGTGKSALACQYVLSAARRGEKAAIFLFDENQELYLDKAKGLGMDLEPYVKSGLVRLETPDATETTPGGLAHGIREAVEKDGIRVVCLDSLNGYLNVMPQERFLTIHLHELLAYLNRHGVLSLLCMAQHGLLEDMRVPAEVTYLADTVVIMRFFEAAGEVRKAVSVIKKRYGHHEKTIREMKMGAQGLRVGPPLKEFQGVLKGVPTFFGAPQDIMGNGNGNGNGHGHGNGHSQDGNGHVDGHLDGHKDGHHRDGNGSHRDGSHRESIGNGAP